MEILTTKILSSLIVGVLLIDLCSPHVSTTVVAPPPSPEGFKSLICICEKNWYQAQSSSQNQPMRVGDLHHMKWLMPLSSTNIHSWDREKPMGFLFEPLNLEPSDCSLIAQDINKCPFLRNIDKPTNLSFASLDFPILYEEAKGPIFEDGPNFDLAFKLFHGKDGVVPLNGKLETEAVPEFNHLASKAASISMSGFGPGGAFGFHDFFGKRPNKESSRKNEHSSKGEHEALGNEWLEKGNCPIAKSYRAVSGVIPLVATALRPPPGIKLKCPPAIVAARAALAKTALVKTVRPQPLPAKILVIGCLGIAANIPLGVWREHTEKFSLSWFTAVHAAVPFVAMLRKSVLMPKTAMALTIAGSILGQMIGSRAERLRLKAKAERAKLVARASPAAVSGYSAIKADAVTVGLCGKQGGDWDSVTNISSPPPSVCF